MTMKLATLAQRTVYQLGYPLARIWWWAVPQTAEGVAVALRHGEQVVVVRQSFRRGVSLVGGGVSVGEAPAEAAVREVMEEVGILVPVDRLRSLGTVDLVHESRQVRVHLFTAHLPAAVALRPDGAEVVSAMWSGPESLAGRKDLHPILAHWLNMGRH